MRSFSVKRALRSLMTLSLALLLGLGLSIPALAAGPEEEAGEFCGYLMALAPQAPLAGGEEAASLFSVGLSQEAAPVSETLGLYKINDPGDVRELVYAGLVAYIEPDYKAELFDVSIDPNDLYFQADNYLYHLQSPTAGIRARSAWQAGLSGAGVKVAVIDSGINHTHEDAPIHIAPGRYIYYKEDPTGSYDFTDSNGFIHHYNFVSSGDVTDDMGHGTMVSGIIAANTDNGKGTAGIAPDVTILPYKCFTQKPGHMGGLTSNLVRALDYAREDGANVISMSWGVLSDSLSLKNAIDAASAAGCILVAAVGNSGSTTYNYPAAYPNVIGVGATGRDGRVTDFSQRNDSVAVYAPGVTIYSLDYETNTEMRFGNGTSYSAPIVAAAAALLKQADPSLTHGDFAALLADPDNCTPVTAGSYPNFNRGILNLRKLLDAVGCAQVLTSLDQSGLTVRGAFHPKAGTFPEGGGGLPSTCLMLLCGYNAQGHLLESSVQQARLNESFIGENETLIGGDADFGGYTARCTFQNAGQIATVRAFFLSSDLHAPCPPAENTL